MPVRFHDLASRNNDWDFEVHERLFLQIPQLGPSNNGDLTNFSSDNEKGLNVVISGRQCIFGVGIFGTLPLDRTEKQEEFGVHNIQIRVAVQGHILQTLLEV